jgi:hypothetical protein
MIPQMLIAASGLFRTHRVGARSLPFKTRIEFGFVACIRCITHTLFLEVAASYMTRLTTLPMLAGCSKGGYPGKAKRFHRKMPQAVISRIKFRSSEKLANHF